MKKTKTNNNKLLLLVDGENLLHRSYHKFLGFKSKRGEPSGAIYGFFKSLHSLIFRFQPTSVLVTFDNGRSKYRMDVLPEYKGSRKKLGMDYESLQKQKKVIRKILKHLNTPTVFDKKFEMNYEGDDYIALAAHRFHGKVVIVSSDKDFAQLISERVKQFNPSKDELVTMHNCKDIMEFAPCECVDYLSLLGDKSDNIPGYPGIGPVKARQFLNQYKSIAYFMNNDIQDSKFNRDQLGKVWSTNRMLIDLRYFIKEHPISKVPVVSSKTNAINNKKLIVIFDKYSLTSFQSSEFIKPFKNIKPWMLEE